MSSDTVKKSRRFEFQQPKSTIRNQNYFYPTYRNKMQCSDDSTQSSTLAQGSCSVIAFLDAEIKLLCQDLLRQAWLFPTLQKLIEDELWRLVELQTNSQQLKDYVTAATDVYDDFYLEDTFDHDAIVKLVPTASPSDLWKVRKEKLMNTLDLSHKVLRSRYGNTTDLCEDVVRKLEKKVFNKRKMKTSLVKSVVSLALPMFKDLPNVLSVRRSTVLAVETQGQQAGKLTVVGDLHGQFEDLMNILSDTKLCGFPSDDNQILFNGDLVDRGNFSVEILMMVLCIKIVRPGAVHIVRGNHECRLMNESYGFYKDIDNNYKKPDEIKALFAELFNALPIAAVIEDTVFVTHGGLGATVGTMTIDDINKTIDRFVEPPMSGPMHELLWSGKIVVSCTHITLFSVFIRHILRDRTFYSDPTDQTGKKSTRTGAQADMFTCDVTKTFLSRNNLRFMIRSHEDCAEGYKKEHEELCRTVFSAPNYCGHKGNKGAVIRFESADLTPTVVQFEAVHYSEQAQLSSNRKRKCKELLAAKATLKMDAEVREVVVAVMAAVVGTVLGAMEGALAESGCSIV